MVAPQGRRDRPTATFSTGQTYTEADFDKQYKQDLDTQAVIDRSSAISSPSTTKTSRRWWGW